jgi:hypothetical protein
MADGEIRDSPEFIVAYLSRFSGTLSSLLKLPDLLAGLRLSRGHRDLRWPDLNLQNPGDHNA